MPLVRGTAGIIPKEGMVSLEIASIEAQENEMKTQNNDAINAARRIDCTFADISNIERVQLCKDFMTVLAQGKDVSLQDAVELLKKLEALSLSSE